MVFVRERLGKRMFRLVFMVIESAWRIASDPKISVSLRPRGRHRDSFVGLPNTRGRSSPPQPPALGSMNRSSALGYSHLVGILFLGAAADCYSSQWSRRPDLRRGGDSRLFRGLTGCWFAQASGL